MIRLLAPEGTDSCAATLVAGRALRAFVDGTIAVLLPAYLLALGFDVWTVGVLSTATLLGSALTTLAVGAWGHRFSQRRLLLAAAALMTVTGLGFAGLLQFWPMLLVAFIGTLNPSAGDVSVFVPLWSTRNWRARRKATPARACSPVTACLPRSPPPSARWRLPCRRGWRTTPASNY